MSDSTEALPALIEAAIGAYGAACMGMNGDKALAARMVLDKAVRAALAQQAATPSDPDEMAAAEQAHMDVCHALAKALGVTRWQPHEGEWDDAPRGNVLAILEAAGLYDPETGEVARQAATPAPAEPVAEELSSECLDCGGTGMRDSGGFHPWGEAAYVPCECAAPPATPAAQPAEPPAAGEPQ